MNSNHIPLPADFDAAVAKMDTLFALPGNFGYIRREAAVCGKRAVLYLAESLCDMEEVRFVLSACQRAEPSSTIDAAVFADVYLPYGETEQLTDTEQMFFDAATGCMLLLCEAFPGVSFSIKCRNIPCRSLEEPEHDKVLRGNHVGFGETLPRNCALLRRQLPDPHLIMKSMRIGAMSQTNVVLCYVRGKADMQYVDGLERQLAGVRCDALSLGMQSLAECLCKTRVWNPFPRFRYTERPDAAAASLAEGSVLILCDNAPQAMILPVSIFSFLQETNDFYMPPFTGTYLRMLRLATFLLSVYLTPIWYALIKFTDPLPQWLSFLAVTKVSAVPILLQLLLIELAIDGLKMASMNTPSALSNSLSVIGGLILGEFAIEVGWFLPETILYMSVVAIAHFTQNNYELGYAFKYVRVAMLLLTAVIGWWGVLLGTGLFLFLLATTPTPEPHGRYFYPLLPFHGPALFSLFFRRRKQLPKSSHA